ncbi:MAG: T9SS type A sorting domain-containing protein [Bacteroidia bacterium]
MDNFAKEGEHFTLDAAKFNSGIYMYSLTSGTSTVTRRMVVAK